MKVINEIVIENFKGIQKINLTCGDINIIVGPNNTGKSSILQSIWLAITSLNSFNDVLDNEVSDIIIDKSNIKYLINQCKERANIKLNLFNNEIDLDLIYTNKKLPNDLSEYFLNYISDLNYLDPELPIRHDINYRFFRELQKANRLNASDDSKAKLEEILKDIKVQMDSEIQRFRKELMESEKLFIMSKLNNILLSVNLINDDFDQQIYQSEEISPIVEIPLIISSPHVPAHTVQLYQKLFNSKKLAEVIGILKKKILYFEDIAIVDDEVMVSLKNINHPLPLSYMGDGFKALLKLSFMAPLIKDGIILFEEPETSMHPGYSEVLAEEIISNSRYSQFFITTHSLELLDYLLKKAEKSGDINSIKIFRLSRRGDLIDRAIYSGTDAIEDMEDIKIDLRGY